jgi:hypothetical protein
MERERNIWEKSFYHRAIQSKIGQGLRAQYDQDLAQPLPHRLFTLLLQLGERQNAERGERPEQDRPDR